MRLPYDCGGDVEIVIADEKTYYVVRKRGKAAVMAEETDSRNQ